MKTTPINNCAIHDLFHLLGKKWALLILSELDHNKELSFNQIKKQLANITNRVLSMRLRQLEQFEIIKKKVTPQKLHSVEYFITKKGSELMKIFNLIKVWGIKHQFTMPCCLNNIGNECLKE